MPAFRGTKKDGAAARFRFTANTDDVGENVAGFQDIENGLASLVREILAKLADQLQPRVDALCGARARHSALQNIRCNGR